MEQQFASDDDNELLQRLLDLNVGTSDTQHSTLCDELQSMRLVFDDAVNVVNTNKFEQCDIERVQTLSTKLVGTFLYCTTVYLRRFIPITLMTDLSRSLNTAFRAVDVIRYQTRMIREGILLTDYMFDILFECMSEIQSGLKLVDKRIAEIKSAHATSARDTPAVDQDMIDNMANLAIKSTTTNVRDNW